MPPVKDKPADAPATGVPVEDVTALVDSFKSTMKEVTDKLAQPQATPQKANDSAAKLAAAKERYTAAREKANEMAAAGDTAGAVEELYQGILAVQSASQIDPETAPATKALIATAKRACRTDNVDVFSTYGAEVEAEMGVLPIDQRIDPDAWDSAVNRVKARHIDEIIAAKEAAHKAAAAAADDDGGDYDTGVGYVTPLASRARRSRSTGDAASADKLSEDQREAAKVCGLTDEKYADAVNRYEAARIKRGPVVRLLDESATPVVLPGRF